VNFWGGPEIMRFKKPQFTGFLLPKCTELALQCKASLQ